MAKTSTVVIGISGSSAAYKICELIRLIRRRFEIHVVLTRHAEEFVTPKSLSVLTGNPVLTSLFEEKLLPTHAHIQYAERADVFLIAPATANIIGKVANGISDDALTTVAAAILPEEVPCFIAPAMNPKMYRHPATRTNLRRLSEWGYRVISPDVGNLTCGLTGEGRLPEPQTIAEIIFKAAGIESS